MKKSIFFMAVALLFASPAIFTSCGDDYWDGPGPEPDGPWYGDNEPWWYSYDDGNWNWNNNYYNNGGDYNGDSGQGNTVLDEAQVLNGEWDGTMVYTNGDTGEQSQFYANMTFVQNNANSIKGTGTEIDYTLDSNNQVADQQTLKFDWYIEESTGDIYIHYTNTENQSTFVMDISASQHGFELVENQYFRGYMIGTNNNDMIYINLNRQLNNNAKSATRSSVTSSRSFGSNNVASLNGGTNKLDNRR